MRATRVLIILFSGLSYLASTAAVEGENPQRRDPPKPPIVFHGYERTTDTRPVETIFLIRHQGRMQAFKLEQTIPGTNYKVAHFRKIIRESRDAGMSDASELTLTDTVSGESIILTILQMIR
jgi:hypothetical protein